MSKKDTPPSEGKRMPRWKRVLILALPCLLLLISALVVIPQMLRLSGDVPVEATPTPPPAPASTPHPVLTPSPVLETRAPTPEPVSMEEAVQDTHWREIDGETYYFINDSQVLTGLRQIEGKLYYFNMYGQKADALGIDVSYYNKGINWPAVKAQGIDFAILRASYRGWETGLLWDDSCFAQNLQGAMSAGVDVGVYVYSTAVTPVEAVQEANMLLDRLHGVKLECPIFFDTEQSGDYPNGRADRLSKAQRAAIVHAFCATVQSHGYDAGVYSGLNFFKNHINYPTLSRYTTWLANYTSFNRLPNFDRPYDMWQFTDHGAVNGIRGLVDMNVIYN